MNRFIPLTLITCSLLLSAAIFGFFYAWVCSTMWGLDNADPRVAMAAMQAMNASVRNMVFAPAFFGTPVLMVLTTLVLARQGHRIAALLMGGGALTYLVLGLALTMRVNVPMNEELARLIVPEHIAHAQKIWDDYSPTWQVWNVTRTAGSGAAFLLALCGSFVFIGQTRTA